LECPIRHEAERADELVGLAARRRTEPLNIGGGRAVPRREDWLIACEGVGGIADAIETSPMPLEHAKQAHVGPRRDLGDVVCRGRAELAKLKLALFVAYVHTIEGKCVEVHVEPERAVRCMTASHAALITSSPRATSTASP
jgi:hypothetical protein